MEHLFKKRTKTIILSGGFLLPQSMSYCIGWYVWLCCSSVEGRRRSSNHPWDWEIFYRGCAGGWLGQTSPWRDVGSVSRGWWPQVVACSCLPDLTSLLRYTASVGLLCTCFLVDSHSPLASDASRVLPRVMIEAFRLSSVRVLALQ